MRRPEFRSVIGLMCVALLCSGFLGSCDDDDDDDAPEMSLRWSRESKPEGECPSMKIDIEVIQGLIPFDKPLNPVLTLYVNDATLNKPVAHSSTFVKTSETSGSFDLTVGKTLPRQSVRSGYNRLDAYVSDPWLGDESLNGFIEVGDCDEEPETSSAAAPEPASESGSDVQQPVSELKAEFHFGQTSGCPFMQAVDVAGVADNADVSLKFSIDGTPVEHTSKFVNEGEYVQDGFDGYFNLVAGFDFDAALEGEHTLQVEVSDGVGSVTIEGTFTADSC